MFNVGYTDGDGVKRWELTAMDWRVARIVLVTHGVGTSELLAMDRLIDKNPDEYWEVELDDLPRGGCIYFVGEVGGWGGRVPQQRAGDEFTLKHGGRHCVGEKKEPVTDDKGRVIYP